MYSQFKHILDNSIEQKIDYGKYHTFFLNEYFKISDKNIIDIIKEYVECSPIEVKVYYNSQTLIFNNIGVLDIDDYRIIDLDDDMYTMTNKGIDKQVQLDI